MSTKNGLEAELIRRLAIYLDCEKEINIGTTGRIDLLDRKRKWLIEVKRLSNFKHAIGQLNSYKAYFPDYTNIAIFFYMNNKELNYYLNTAVKSCAENNIKVATLSFLVNVNFNPSAGDFNSNLTNANQLMDSN